jgi:dolichyl-phosphate-mannose--protein O-mannosyl transferase
MNLPRPIAVPGASAPAVPLASATGAATSVGARIPLGPLLLLALATALHFAWFAHPLTVVLDEVYFARFGLDYLRHEFYFDTHPPLAKLIYGATAWLAGLDPSFSFATNLLPLPDASYLWLRVPPRIAGALLPLALYGIGRELGLSRTAALVVGALAALDNGLLAYSRFALLDPFLLLAGFGALWCALRARRHAGDWRWTLAAAALAGAALATKWTGLAFVGMVLLLQAVDAWRMRRPAALGRMAAGAALIAAIYVASFALHFAWADRTGTDAQFMSPAFQATLAGNAYAADPAQRRAGFGEKFVEAHVRMLDRNRSMTNERHPYGSRWYEWPFMMRSLDMWADHSNGHFAHIYFLGNPAVWWVSGYCALFLLVNLVPRLGAWALRDERRAQTPPAEIAMVVAYLANLLPFVPIARVMFTYHYLAALCVALLMTGLLLDRTGRHARALGIALVALAAVAFVYFAPLTYGFALTPAEFDARMWLRGWR